MINHRRLSLMIMFDVPQTSLAYITATCVSYNTRFLNYDKASFVNGSILTTSMVFLLARSTIFKHLALMLPSLVSYIAGNQPSAFVEADHNQIILSIRLLGIFNI